MLPNDMVSQQGLKNGCYLSNHDLDSSQIVVLKALLDLIKSCFPVLLLRPVVLQYLDQSFLVASTIFTGPVQGSLSIGVFGGRVCTSFTQQLQHLHTSSAGWDRESVALVIDNCDYCGFTTGIFGFWGGPSIQENLDYLQVTHKSSYKKAVCECLPLASIEAL